MPQPLTIRVPISGYPAPAARWTFGEKELTAAADERVSITTKSTFTELMVAPSVRPDRGCYTLQLENDMTSVSGEIEVSVIGETRHLLLLLIDSLIDLDTFYFINFNETQTFKLLNQRSRIVLYYLP